MTQAPVRVLVVDDQKVVRDGLAMILGLLPDIQVTGTAVDGDDAIRQALADVPDVILMDLNMPNCDGVTATRRILAERPEVRVVVLTTYSDDTSVFDALGAGARGYLTKDAGAEEIQRAVTTVAAGEAQLDPAVQRRLLEALTSGGAPTTASRPEPASPPPASTTSTIDGLTPREVEVLVEIAGGLSNDEIAAKLYVSVATVKTHVNRLLAKTGQRDRAQLVAYAFRNGLADCAKSG